MQTSLMRWEINICGFSNVSICNSSGRYFSILCVLFFFDLWFVSRLWSMFCCVQYFCVYCVFDILHDIVIELKLYVICQNVSEFRLHSETPIQANIQIWTFFGNGAHSTNMKYEPVPNWIYFLMNFETKTEKKKTTAV